jgi:Ulp1 family protease
VASQADQLQRDMDSDDDLKALIQRVQKDLSFNATLRDQQEIYEKLRQSDAVRKLEERMKLNEANKRAALLMRPLSHEERDLVEDAIQGDGPEDEILAQCGSDSIIRKSLRTLTPGQWLNDEVIHYFLLMLSKRDEEICERTPQSKRSHFFKSFFITKLLNEGNATCEGQYEYRNVRRWSKNVPGKDIFSLEKIFFPVNMGELHWICVVVFMTERRIQVYDSMGSSGRRYLRAIFQYLDDEHVDKKKQPLPDKDKWELVETTRDTPQQRNGMCIFLLVASRVQIHSLVVFFT